MQVLKCFIILCPPPLLKKNVTMAMKCMKVLFLEQSSLQYPQDVIDIIKILVDILLE